MKTTFNKKSDSFTISGLTAEQIGVIAFLVNRAQELTCGKHEEKMLEEDGFIDLASIGCITFDKDEVDTLHTIHI